MMLCLSKDSSLCFEIKPRLDEKYHNMNEKFSSFPEMIELTKQQEEIVQQAVHWFKYESSQTFEISGKAGTGKSTTLRHLLKKISKRNIDYVVLAPTGIAAKNVNGATIHSLFQLRLIPILSFPFY